ncbi:MAG: hypothetical protein ACRD6I_14130, partial [Candidatus Acidiferrales bacterium]
LLVRAEVKGPKTAARTVLLFVDTGASYTHLDARFLDLPRSSRSLRIVGIAGAVDMKVLERVTLTLDGTAAAFDLQTVDVDLAKRRQWCKCDLAGVLGLDVLRRFASVTIDFEAGVLRLRQPAPGPVADLRERAPPFLRPQNSRTKIAGNSANRLPRINNLPACW